MIKLIYIFRSFLIIILSGTLLSCVKDQQVQVTYNTSSDILSYGAKKLTTTLLSAGYSIATGQETGNDLLKIRILTREQDVNKLQQDLLAANLVQAKPDGFKILRTDTVIYVLSPTDRGALYGIHEVLEQIGPSCDFTQLVEQQVDPAFSFRAIKFNLPWSPYRPGPATDLHIETCRDLTFWEAFLDMMVKNRFNTLSLWNTHPFPYMIRATNYPRATPFSDEELAEWKTFWKTLFKMAKDRGIETFLVNWNIVVSPAFAEAYGADVYNDQSELVKKYTRESVTQLINEYPNLTGLGVTLADWMGNWGDHQMTPVDREDWIEETFVAGMKNADRKIKFIHRAVLAGDPKEMRRVIDHADLPDRTIVEVKFNWSHGHSTPNLSLTHSNDQGTIMRGFWDPPPENYFIAWMIRNEDFFVLRWGDPEFIRNHIRTNNLDYVDGYFVGSEGYIPAKDYSQKDQPAKTWDYAFQKQWLFYHLWGRLLYHPDETDSTLARAFAMRYPESNALKLLKASSLASKVPLYLASFYKGTWDFTLYSEGFLAPWQAGFDDEKSPFISLEELIKHETLDSLYLNILEYCQLIKEGNAIDEAYITPLELAQKVQETCRSSMALINQLRSTKNSPTLTSELDDMETWCYLGSYFADKLRAGVACQNYYLTGSGDEKAQALSYLEKCVSHWENIIRLTEDRYQPMPYVSIGHHDPRWPDFTEFHWKFFLDEVKTDIDYVNNLKTN